MGRRSRKRGGVPAAAPAAEATSARRHPTPKTHRARRSEAPKAPWSPFPLVELCVLIALVLIVLGFLSDGDRRTAMLAGGIALASLAGLEIAIREHFAGYRSHTALLAGAVALAVLIGLTLLAPGIPVILRLVVAVAVFLGAARFLVRVFQRRSGL